MNPPIYFSLIPIALTLHTANAQELPKPPPPGLLIKATVMPAAVVEAPVSREKFISGGAGKDDLTIQVIDAPVLPPSAVLPPKTNQASRRTPEQWAAMRAAAPEITRWFSPQVTVYPNGVSHISWSGMEVGAGDGQFEAWLKMDLSAFEFMQDVEVGKTRYVVMPLMMDYRWRSIPKRIPPAPGDFTNQNGVMLAKGDTQNAAALAPLNAMLSLYAEKKPELVAEIGRASCRERV